MRAHDAWRSASASLISALLAACSSGVPSEAPTTTSSTSTPTAQTAPDAVTDATCAQGTLGDVRMPFALPPGVTEDTRERSLVIADADAFHMAPEVTFAITGAPHVDGGRIVMRGELVNAAAEPREVFLSEAGHGYVAATLTTDATTGTSLARRPGPAAAGGPPALFPEPHHFTMAPGAHWPFDVAVLPACWSLTPGQTVTMHWWLSVHGESREGDVTVVVP